MESKDPSWIDRLVETVLSVAAAVLRWWKNQDKGRTGPSGTSGGGSSASGTAVRRPKPKPTKPTAARVKPPRSKGGNRKQKIRKKRSP